MVVDIEWHKEAEKEFLKLEKEIQEEIRIQKNKLAEKGLHHEKAGPVFEPELGLEAFKLKIDTGKANHRLIFDIHSSKYVIYKVGEGEEFYSLENLEEVENRK